MWTIASVVDGKHGSRRLARARGPMGDKKGLTSFLAGGVAGALEISCTMPLDTVGRWYVLILYVFMWYLVWQSTSNHLTTALRV